MLALQRLMQNPLWWVVPAILIGSWLMNHRSSPSGDSPQKEKKETKAAPKQSEAPKPESTPEPPADE